MKKTYPPYQLTYSAPAGTDVLFKVTYISDTNFGSTFVNLPGSTDDKLITDTKEYNLGKIEDFTSERTVVASNYFNAAPEEDTIKIEYNINGKIVVHENLKSEADDVVILIIITFIAI